MRAFILALAMIATPAAAAEQFDLVCTAKKETVRYRIDLTRGEWCARDCGLVRKIAEVTSGTITLADKKAQFRDDDSLWITINRVTGDWFYSQSIPTLRLYETTKGACKPADFSGFPSSKAQF